LLSALLLPLLLPHLSEVRQVVQVLQQAVHVTGGTLVLQAHIPSLLAAVVTIPLITLHHRSTSTSSSSSSTATLEGLRHDDAKVQHNMHHCRGCTVNNQQSFYAAQGLLQMYTNALINYAALLMLLQQQLQNSPTG
jgi:hypothetical protein